MTWRRFETLLAGLPDRSAWHRHIAAEDIRPESDPDEAKKMLTQYYPGLGG